MPNNNKGFGLRYALSPRTFLSGEGIRNTRGEQEPGGFRGARRPP